MKRIKPVIAVAALVMAILGERWLRSQMRPPAWRLPLSSIFFLLRRVSGATVARVQWYHHIS